MEENRKFSHFQQKPKGSVTAEQAFQKLKHYCAYQERCHSEVKEKLYSLGLWQTQVEELISKLIEENYLNEERFAGQFAGGKFRMKHWGRVKITHELKKKGVSPYNIRKGLLAIDGDQYDEVFAKLAGDKLDTLRNEKNIFIKKKKVQDFLLQRGFERDLINDFLRGMGSK
ncbi:MAG: RecX family transcriptional regulator [Chitinophagaceae bacterium]|nr:MAG: RecX family transcriptional regulator [Chitinophagaceae bacterium]